TQWLQSYADAIAEHGERPALHKENEAYRFGTGRVHVSSFYVIVCFELGDKIVKVRTSIITGDIPLLLSKGALGKLGMVFDVENMRADFHKVGLKQFELMSTASGHPAIPIVPAKASAGTTPALEIEDLELAPKESYTSVFAVAYQGPLKPDLTGIFQPKKLDPAVRNLLSEDRLAQDPYLAWWKQTPIDRLSFTRLPLATIRTKPPGTMSSQPCATTALSKMNKTELLAEAVRVGLVVHKSWSNEELKSILREHREKSKTEDGKMAMRGLAGLTMSELKTKEVPTSYGEWAVAEANRSDNASPDLIRFAKWYHKERTLKKMQNYGTEEFVDPTPFPDDDSSNQSAHQTPLTAWRGAVSSPPPTRGYKGSSSTGSWEAVASTPHRSGKGNQKIITPKRSNPEEEEAAHKTMESEVDPAVLDEIQVLQTRLALLKDKVDYQEGKCCAEIYQQDARAAYRAGDFSYETCRGLLEGAQLPTRPMRTMCNYSDPDKDQVYITYGMFVHGGVRGVTTATKEHSDLGSEQLKNFLKNNGFPLPRKTGANMPRTKQNTFPRKAKRHEIANTAGKLSVLFTTLLLASQTYLSEVHGPPPSPDPIVMMEIGGREGTIEAVELNKAVVEPMEWEDLLEPKAQETAHYFVTGATPKELRVHLDEMPRRCYDFMIGLVRAQLEEGGEVVLRGRDLQDLTEVFKEYVSYHDHSEQDGWVVLRRERKGQRLLPGHEGGRPHEVHAVQTEEAPERQPRKLDGSGITFDGEVPGHVQSALRRLHQNLGHTRDKKTYYVIFDLPDANNISSRPSSRCDVKFANLQRSR
ncbi:unnamed protein product, partial [Symbiodinium sp. CCMP2456]